MIAFCDGSALGHPGPGGIAVVFVATEGGDCSAFSARLESVTSARAELLAALAAIKLAPNEGEHLTVYSDSCYVTRGVNEWITRWRERGYRNARGKQIANRDLWRALDRLLALHPVTFRRVRGHQGNPLNEIADRLAKDAAKQGGQNE